MDAKTVRKSMSWQVENRLTSAGYQCDLFCLGIKCSVNASNNAQPIVGIFGRLCCIWTHATQSRLVLCQWNRTAKGAQKHFATL